MSGRRVVGIISLLAGLVIATAAWAGECKVVVTEDGEPVVEVEVVGVTADGQRVGPVFTDAGGQALLSGPADAYEVHVRGMVAGRCSGFLTVDFRALKEQYDPGAADETKPDPGAPGSGADETRPPQDGTSTSTVQEGGKDRPRPKDDKPLVKTKDKKDKGK